MGQSSSSGPTWDSSNETRTQGSHYELLGVEPSATDDDIKRAYRRKALELHPDRNYGSVESATRLFAEVQTAYEVLSDPQERAWYDSHQDVLSKVDGVGVEEHYQRNVKVTTAEDLAKMCLHRNAYTDFSDSASGFFKNVRDVFERLAFEERVACDIQSMEAKDYPSFGSSDDAYEDSVKPFYSVWSNFATQKNFPWKDVFRYSDATDRRTRRMMEKENRRHREEAIGEFNDAVRTLVAFVKKRDPRYKPDTRTDAERHQSMRKMAAVQAAQARAANHARMANVEMPAWTRANSVENYESEESSEEELRQHFECVICDKIFKSENQYEAHEKSKKHVKATQQLRMQMRQENIVLGLDTGEQPDLSTSSVSVVDGHESFPQTVGEDYDPSGTSQSLAEETRGLEKESPIPAERTYPNESEDSAEDSSAGTGEEYAPRALVEQRILGSKEEDVGNTISRTPEGEDYTTLDKSQSIKADEQGSKKGKAKEKRAKKAAKAAQTDGAMGLYCVTCKASFPSKTKLHDHLNEFGHARPLIKINDGWKRKVVKR